MIPYSLQTVQLKINEYMPPVTLIDFGFPVRTKKGVLIGVSGIHTRINEKSVEMDSLITQRKSEYSYN